MKKLLSTIVVMLLPMMVCANYNEKYISGSWSHENPDATVDGISLSTQFFKSDGYCDI